jgi:sigma-E factor negative regulatory protein RseC
MSSQKESIEHSCKVDRIEGDYAFVSLVSQPACSSCHAKGACGLADNSTQIIRVNTGGMKIARGETVTLMLEKSLGFKAVLLAYVIPFLFFLLALIFFLHVTKNELLGGMLALSALIPYYLVLYLRRRQLDRDFLFTIKKM